MFRASCGSTGLKRLRRGIFPITVTLLVLELKVLLLRQHERVLELIQGLRELLPKFLSWLISFVIVCQFWLKQHHLLTFARHPLTE